MNIKFLTLVLLITSTGLTVCSKNSDEQSAESCEQMPKTWRKIGYYSPDQRIYSSKTDVIGFNFFYDTAYLYLPKNQDSAVRVKLLSGKLKKQPLTFNENMLQPEAKTPTVWYPAKNGPQFDDCGAYTIAVNWHENGMDRTVKVSQNDTNIASFVCTDSSQIVLNDHCFACAGNGKKRTAIIINAETNEYITISDDLKEGESTERHPVVHYNNGLVFIQWPETIYCVDIKTGKQVVYSAAHTIETMQPSADNHYMVVCEQIPTKKDETASFTLLYQLFDLSGNRDTIKPTEQPKQQEPKKKQCIAKIFSFLTLNKKK